MVLVVWARKPVRSRFQVAPWSWLIAYGVGSVLPRVEVDDPGDGQPAAVGQLEEVLLPVDDALVPAVELGDVRRPRPALVLGHEQDRVHAVGRVAVPAHPGRARPDPAAVAQLGDRVADLEGRADERRLDAFDRAPGVAAVEAPGEDQLHLGVADGRHVDDARLGVVAVHQAAHRDHRPVRHQAAPDRLRRRPAGRVGDDPLRGRSTSRRHPSNGWRTSGSRGRRPPRRCRR